jgi:hypothetical protein
MMARLALTLDDDGGLRKKRLIRSELIPCRSISDLCTPFALSGELFKYDHNIYRLRPRKACIVHRRKQKTKQKATIIPA